MRARITVGICFAVMASMTMPGHVASGQEEVAPGLKVGDVLDQSNWQLAKDLLPPEVLEHYKRGEYRNRIAVYPSDPPHWDADFEAATKENAEYLDVDDRGTIIDKRTGQQPPHYYGIPFPTIDANDPKGGAKAVWNQFVNYWNVGNARYHGYIVMISPTGPDRSTVQDVYFLYYDGQAAKLTPPANPLNLSMQYLAVAEQPADLNGTAALTWRYRDPGKRDSVWAYVPAMRRVRAVSPANRSDGFLGSDVSQDDGHFFDGKPEDFSWKMIGYRDALRFADPVSMAGYMPVPPAKGGGWMILIEPDLPTVGYRTPGWKGLAWAPTDPVLVKHRLLLVEGVPHDKYYLYGRLELWMDPDTWLGAWNRKFGWNGELIATYQISGTRNHPAGPPEAREWLWNGALVYQCVENFKSQRASCAGFRPYPGAEFVRRVPLSPSLFDSQTLNRFGK